MLRPLDWVWWKEIRKCIFESYRLIGYIILRVIAFFLELVLLMPLPDYVPIYATQEGVFKNPATGYFDEMFAPICYDEPQGIFAAACPWSHGVNGVSVIDYE